NVAATIRAAVRDGDTVARYGGEEIAVLMPQTELLEAFAVAERIRGAIDGLVTRYRGLEVGVTVSIGCAALSPGDQTVADVAKRAFRPRSSSRRSSAGSSKAPKTWPPMPSAPSPANAPMNELSSSSIHVSPSGYRCAAYAKPSGKPAPASKSKPKP